MSWLVEAADRYGQKPALLFENRQVTFHELLNMANHWASALSREGVVSGTRVAIELPPGIDFVAALHGCFLLGAVAVPIDLRLGESERENLCELLRPKLKIDSDFASNAVPGETEDDGDRSRLMAPLADSVATVICTSGSTGTPKPVELTYCNWQASAEGSRSVLGHDPEDLWLCALPLSHVGGLSIPIRSVIYGTAVELHSRFSVEAVLDSLSSGRATLVSLVPTMLTRLLDAGLTNPPRLRCALVGGGPVPEPLFDRAHAAGVPVVATYGMTEACSQLATASLSQPLRLRPLPGVELSIAEGFHGGSGEILARGSNLAAGAVASDGWLHTGDLGEILSDGSLAVYGRADQTVISGGENVMPEEVERCLLVHPDVEDAAVFGSNDPEWGEAVSAQVVLAAQASPNADALKEFCRARLAGFKVPKRIEFVSALPRTETGKLIRAKLPV